MCCKITPPVMQWKKRGLHDTGSRPPGVHQHRVPGSRIEGNPLHRRLCQLRTRQLRQPHVRGGAQQDGRLLPPGG